MRTVLIVNLIASSASAAWGAVALARPEALSGSKKVENGDLFYARMYAVRAMPFGLTAGILPLRFTGNAAAWVLFTAAAIQGLDILIAAGRKQPAMAAAAAVGATVHLACGLAIV